MKYFWELTPEQQETVLTELQPLPLFKHYKEDARMLLLTSKNYVVGDDLKVHATIGENNVTSIT